MTPESGPPLDHGSLRDCHGAGRCPGVPGLTAPKTVSLLNALGYEWEARARLQSEHALMKIKEQHLVIQPYLQAETSTLQYRPGSDRFGQVRGGVRFELPF